jgi:hypothetical protein
MRAASKCAPVKILTRADSDNRIRVGECSEDTDFVRVFELGADSHDCWILGGSGRGWCWREVSESWRRK